MKRWKKYTNKTSEKSNQNKDSEKTENKIQENTERYKDKICITGAQYIVMKTARR